MWLGGNVDGIVGGGDLIEPIEGEQWEERGEVTDGDEQRKVGEVGGAAGVGLHD